MERYNAKRNAGPEGRAKKSGSDKLYRHRGGLYPRREWTSLEIAIAAYLVGKGEPIRKIGFALNRSWASVHQKMRRKKPLEDELIAVEEAVKRLGYWRG